MWQGEEVVHDAIRDVLLARAAPAHVAAVLRRLGAVSEEVRETPSCYQAVTSDVSVTARRMRALGCSCFHAAQRKYKTFGLSGPKEPKGE